MMSPQELREMANESDRVTLQLPRPWKGRPAGFPSGELLCEFPKTNTVSINSKKLLAWLDKNGL